MRCAPTANCSPANRRPSCRWPNAIFCFEDGTMLTLHTRLEHADNVTDSVVLAYDQRERCRLRVQLASGREAALFLPRGSVLRDGDLLTGPEGEVVRVQAALEATYRVSA